MGCPAPAASCDGLLLTRLLSTSRSAPKRGDDVKVIVVDHETDRQEADELRESLPWVQLVARLALKLTLQLARR